MEQKPTFIEFIQHICKRPGMYTLGGSYNETSAFIAGYSAGNDSPINNRIFDRFVCLKNSFPSNYTWTYVIKECSKDDNEAISLMEKTILEFIELKNKMTEDELIKFAIESSKTEEGDAEEIFRKFDQALLIGDKEIIQSIIIENKGAEILWSGSYLTDVAKKLTKMASEEPIKKIFISEDNSMIKIIASGWPFPIEMNLINGEWKVNATNIIELRKNNKSAQHGV